MVLRDVNDASSDSFNDNPYPSENDAYASSSSPYHFDASSLPQPIPLLGPLLGFSAAAIRFKTESTIKFAEQKVGRQLNPEEAQALASHLYKLEQTKSYFTTVGAALGTWRCYATTHENRYPFYKPKPEDVNPNKFLFVKGPLAQYSRHSWRLLAYMFVAAEAGKLLGQLFAQPLAARDTSQDPRLEQFGHDLKHAFSGNAQGPGSVAAAREKEWRERINKERAGQENAAGTASSPRWERMRKAAPVPTQNDDDDMSPTAGNEPWGSFSDSWNDSSSSPDSSQSAPQSRLSTTGTWGRRPAASRSDDDADASPTGGLFQDEAQSQNQSKPGDSAWERLRRGGAPAPLQGHRPPQSRRSEPARGERKEESSLGDTFTFVEDDEERKRERERAQREFDARIERERQGKDFNEEGKRW